MNSYWIAIINVVHCIIRHKAIDIRSLPKLSPKGNWVPHTSNSISEVLFSPIISRITEDKDDVVNEAIVAFVTY